MCISLEHFRPFPDCQAKFRESLRHLRGEDIEIIFPTAVHADLLYLLMLQGGGHRYTIDEHNVDLKVSRLS